MNKSSNNLVLLRRRLEPWKVGSLSGCTVGILKSFFGKSRLALVLLLSANLLLPLNSMGKSKYDKFHGTVVNAGPKAVTVKSQANIYQVRTFNYAPDLEKKIQDKRPPAGKKVTVRFLRGTDMAVSIK